ncbi:hypothetical protein PGT21_034660 [Puccinia graminis f. sp. tritici]|uniref:Uncharacterized protein n=1 Tax=Puccinia graminis f. sp. tritici TaxID=56615 RepID=A0A5B0MFJ3_PUCGR|nr:hypothetical protein PGT21_034660 [Puccinia graminis f. sp. tritici]
MPNSEHIHSGYKYSFSDAVVCDPKLTCALKEFPSDCQIDELLKLAEKRANILIEFTGMQKVPGEKISDSSLPCSSPVTSSKDDVSISITKQYYYKPHNHDQSDDNTNIAIKEAALIAGERHALDHELASHEETHESLESQTTQTSRVSIQSLLNPQSKFNVITEMKGNDAKITFNQTQQVTLLKN